MNEYHRINLMEALAGVEATPATRICLDHHRCSCPHGQAFGIAGMVAWLPHFRHQGVHADPSTGGPVMVAANGAPLDIRPTLDHLFGPFCRDDQALFAGYGAGAWDAQLLARLDQRPSHKELAMQRLHHVLALVAAAAREARTGNARPLPRPSPGHPLAA